VHDLDKDLTFRVEQLGPGYDGETLRAMSLTESINLARAAFELDRRMAEISAGAERDADQKDNRQLNEHRANPRATSEYRAAFNRFLYGGVGSVAGEELRALQAGSDPAGGYLVAPEQSVIELIKAVDDQVAIRCLSKPQTPPDEELPDARPSRYALVDRSIP
jgi:HK97 family phage major capsid protein